MYKQAIKELKEYITDLELLNKQAGSVSPQRARELAKAEKELEYLLEKEPWYD